MGQVEKEGEDEENTTSRIADGRAGGGKGGRDGHGGSDYSLFCSRRSASCLLLCLQPSSFAASFPPSVPLICLGDSGERERVRDGGREELEALTSLWRGLWGG